VGDAERVEFAPAVFCRFGAFFYLFSQKGSEACDDTMANWQKRNKFKEQEKARLANQGVQKNPFRSTASLKDQLKWSDERRAAEELLDRDFGYPMLTPGTQSSRTFFFLFFFFL
jgi:hypothetical protein